MLNYNTELYMKKIEYFCCLLGLVLTGLACQDDDETTVIPKPEGITYGTVTDKGGNVYKTLTIGNQTWLAENFRYRPDEATAADLVTYGESYGGTERAILEGTNMNSYQTFCRNYSGRKFLLYLREQIFTPFLQAVDRITYDAHHLTVLSSLPTYHPPRSYFAIRSDQTAPVIIFWRTGTRTIARRIKPRPAISCFMP